ncbi:MAG TPA: DUF3368 domain-containing protein [Cyanobacteria bacterium UBA11369]|nr:DUF3368 domain-containing protein [Cyanobacteria bacterium UBA11371]HBE31014.1 DUF3368 domain-containing protein [Cyanobacteria bacterium UBA11368]HBE53911.1 DUF3368 domain-containing protein [Cyanobacteria bacterium UBA11369]
MLIKRVIINSSPLIVLFKSQQAELLPQLFSEILVPAGVWDEITAAGQNDAAARELSSVTWAQRVEIGNIAPEVAGWDLGKGKSEVLSLALNNPDCAAIIDDRAARRCSQSLSITTIGTGRLIILAKQRGLIPLVSPRIQALRDAGLWLSDHLVNLLKIQAGE